MSAELGRIEALGWQATSPDTDGVRYLRRDGADVSYPRGVLGTLDGLGGEGFWLDSRANAVGALLRDYSIPTLWDIGAGAGAMAKRLGHYGVEVISVEPLPEGAQEIASLGGEVFCATLPDLELPAESINAFGLFDVLEHLEDPSQMLDEVTRTLAPTGNLIVTVPAYQSLWSAEDEAVGHFRRYSTKALRSLLRSSGLSVISTRYLFAALVPAAAVLRALPYRMGRGREKSDAIKHTAARIHPRPTVNKLANLVFSAEARIARSVPLPFGLSILAVAKKQNPL